jgi:cytochrome P450
LKAVSFALLDLYTHKEYIAPLRAELENTNLDALKGMQGEIPLLDSFLKESARLSAFESSKPTVTLIIERCFG